MKTLDSALSTRHNLMQKNQRKILYSAVRIHVDKKISPVCCRMVRIHVSVSWGKKVPDKLQHSENTWFCSIRQKMSLTCCSMVRIHVSCSRGQNMPLICCSIVKIHGSVPSDEKRKKSLTCFSMVRKQGSISVLWNEKCP